VTIVGPTAVVRAIQIVSYLAPETKKPMKSSSNVIWVLVKSPNGPHAGRFSPVRTSGRSATTVGNAGWRRVAQNAPSLTVAAIGGPISLEMATCV
jgi:hypothetical protein